MKMRYVILQGRYDPHAHAFLKNKLKEEDIVIFCNASQLVVDYLVDKFNIHHVESIHYYYANFDPDKDCVFSFDRLGVDNEYIKNNINNNRNKQRMFRSKRMCALVDTGLNGTAHYMNTIYVSKCSWIDVLEKNISTAVALDKYWTELDVRDVAFVDVSI